MVMLREREIFAKIASQNRPLEQKSMPGMVGILFTYARPTSKKTKHGVETLNSSTLGMIGLARPTDEDPEKNLGEAAIVQKPRQIEDF